MLNIKEDVHLGPRPMPVILLLILRTGIRSSGKKLQDIENSLMRQKTKQNEQRYWLKCGVT
jgi:hypothetical protein